MRTSISIEELLDSYRDLYRSGDMKQDDKNRYWNEYVGVVEYLMIGRFDVLPYKEEDGTLGYTLRVRT